MPEFSYTDLLPLGRDDTEYRLLTSDGVSTFEAGGRTFLQVEPEALRLLTETAIHDISHLLRPAHLAQLRRILDDPEASPNDRFVALDLLKNASIASGGVLPMCQDTGTAIVMGKRGQHVLTDGRDEEHLSRGVYDAYTRLNRNRPRTCALLFRDAAYISRGMLDGTEQIARDIPPCGAHLRSIDPQRATIETNPVKALRPPKQRGVAPAANVSNDPRCDALRSGIVRAATSQEFCGYCIGQSAYAHGD